MEGVFAWTGANYATGALQVGDWLIGRNYLFYMISGHILCPQSFVKGAFMTHERCHSLGLLQESSYAHDHQARRNLESTQLSQSPGNKFQGIMELGGASFQITFLPLSTPADAANHDADDGPVLEKNSGTVPVKLPGVNVV